MTFSSCPFLGLDSRGREAKNLYKKELHSFSQNQLINKVPIAPDGAAVGLEVRVVGNDSGEKVSILAGTLARLDRDAPVYGRRGYNDFNTFYLQAASGTKGGSSGSPVVDAKGRAVALNAGGRTKAASAYYLPLHRVVRALGKIQQFLDSSSSSSSSSSWSSIVPRGDLQATLVFKGFDECRRLGLSVEREASLRAAASGPGGGGAAADAASRGTGALAVEGVVPGGPACGVLEPGDVLLSVAGQEIVHFLPLESALDDAVGAEVDVSVERGGEKLDFPIRVADLHAVTPKEGFELAGGVVHALSYQFARNQRSPTGAVFVAEPGYLLGRAGIPRAAVVTAVNHEPTPDVRSFAAAIRRAGRRAQVAAEAKERRKREAPLLKEGRGEEGAAAAAAAIGASGDGAEEKTRGAGGEDPTRVPISFFTLCDRFRTRTGVASVDASTLSSGWFGAPLLWQRDDARGFWTATPDWPTSTEDAGQAVQEGKEAEQKEREEEEEEEEEEPREGQEGTERGALSLLLPPPNAPMKRSASSAALAAAVAARDAAIRSSLALVEVEIPVSALVDGVHARRFAGTAVVVYQSRSLGLALVDRNTVPVASADARLSFGGAPADAATRPAFLHPLHNFALLSYDPCDLEAQGVDVSGEVQAARKGRAEGRGGRSALSCGSVAAVALDEAPLAPGDKLHLCGLSKDGRLVKRDVSVINPNAALQVRRADVPRFRAVHEEIVRLDHDYGAFSGVLVRNPSSSSGSNSDAAAAAAAAAAESSSPPPSSSSSSSYSLVPRICGVWASYSEQIDHDEREFCAGLPAATFARWVAAAAQALDGGVPKSLEETTSELSLSSSGSPSSPASSSIVPPLSVPVLDAELETLPLVKAAAHGLPRAWVARLAAADADDRRQALRVKATVSGSAAAEALKPGDLVLAVDGQVVTSFAGIEDAVWRAAAEAAAKGKGNEALPPSSAPSPPRPPTAPTLHLTVCRAGAVLPDLPLLVGFEDGLGTRRVLHWCGAQLQAPHRGVRELGFAPEAAAEKGESEGAPSDAAPAPATSSSPSSSSGTPSGVYVSRWHHGSPAHRYGLYALNFVVAVSGVPTPDLDAFVEAVRGLPDGAPVRVALVHLETTKPKVLTLKQDLRYWPTTELRLEGPGRGWERRVISSVEGGACGGVVVRESKR